jgi:hypothetical protein
LAYFIYLRSCVLYSRINGSIRYAEEISILDSERLELDESNYYLVKGFDWDGEDFDELYSVQGGTYFRENEFED